MGKGKTMIFSAGIMLLVLAAAVFYIGVCDFQKIRPASAYDDEGVHRFVPYRAYPTQVKNSATGRQGRLHPTKTVYCVYYKATDGSGYEWKDQTAYRAEAERMVSEQKSVQRRILSIKETNQYLAVSAEDSAETYTAGLRRSSVLMIGLSTAYAVLYGGIWIMILRKRHRREAG